MMILEPPGPPPPESPPSPTPSSLESAMDEEGELGFYRVIGESERNVEKTQRNPIFYAEKIRIPQKKTTGAAS